MTRRKDHRGRVLNKGEYQRADLTYEYKYTDCSKRRISVYAPTLEELRQKEEQVTRDKFYGIERSAITVSQLFEEWFANKRGIKPTTQDNYRKYYEDYICADYGIGKLPVQSLTRPRIQRFYAEVRAHGIAISSIESIHGIVHQMLDMAVDADILRRNYADRALREIKEDARMDRLHKMMMGEDVGERGRALTLAEQNRFFRYVLECQPWSYDMFRFMLLTGLRVGELMGLQWSDIDFEQHKLIVRHNLVCYKGRDGQKEAWHMSTPKGNKFRELPLADEVFAILSERYKIRKPSATDVDSLRDFVWVSSRNRPLKSYLVNSLLHRIIAKANADAGADDVELPAFTSHWFRHTFATRLLEANVNIKAIQALLGHSDISVTMNTYTDVQLDLKTDDMDALSKYLRRKETQLYVV